MIDILNVHNLSSQALGLPVLTHGSRATLIENCVTIWHKFVYFHKVTFTQNMRALPSEIEFVEILEKNW